jgi:uncharacterized coiled-coil protein SlyX
MPIGAVSNKSHLQTPDQIATIIENAQESHKQAYVDKKGRVQTRSKLGDLVFSIKKAFKGEEWAKSENARNTGLILRAFTNALVHREESRFSSAADKEYISDKIRGWLDKAVTENSPNRRSVRFLGREIAANHLPSARNLRQAARQVAEVSEAKVGRHNQKALDKEVPRLSQTNFAEYREKLNSLSRNLYPSQQRFNALVQEIEAKANQFDARIPGLEAEISSLEDQIRTLHSSLAQSSDSVKQEAEIGNLTAQLEQARELLEDYKKASDTFHRAVDSGKSVRAQYEVQQTANASSLGSAQLSSSESDIENAKDIHARIRALGALHYADDAVDITNTTAEFTPAELEIANELLLGGYDLDVLYEKPGLLEEGYQPDSFAASFVAAYKPYGELAAEKVKSRLVAAYNDANGTKLRFDQLPEQDRVDIESTIRPQREVAIHHAPKIWAQLPLIRRLINTAKANNLDKESTKLLIRRIKGQAIDPKYKDTKYRGLWGGAIVPRPDGHTLFEILNRVEQSAKANKGIPNVAVSQQEKALVNSLVPELQD